MNRTRALLMAIIMAMLLQSPVWSRTITLEEALSSARDSNTDLAVAKVNLETAIRNSSPASSFIPDISIDGSISLDDMTGFGSSWGTLGGDLSLGISMELGTELITDTQIKAIEKESATLEYMLSADSIEEAVITSYWNIAFSRQNLESARMAEEDSREALASVEERYSAGACDELELLEARVAALEYSYERQEYEDSLSLAYTAFSELTGIDEEGFETEPVPDIPALSLPDADSLLELAVPGNLSIRSLRSKEELARTEVMDAKVRNQFPSVSLSASYHLGADQTVTEWEGLKSDRGSISIGFSIPISSYIPGSSGRNQDSD